MSNLAGFATTQVTYETRHSGSRDAYRDSHILTLLALILAELLLTFLDGHILQEVCIVSAFRALKAKLAEEGHHL